MPYVIGIDGGQTSTVAVVMDSTGRVLGAGHGGPANHIHEPGGVERVRRSIADAMAGARLAAGLPDAPIASAYLGMTGGSPAMEEVCRPVVDAEAMELGHDSLIALYAVTFGRPGIVVIGGTGSVGFGRDAQGHTARAGGWGYVFGDEGSGYWIAVRALNAAARAQDGTGPTTTLLSYLAPRANAASLEEIHHLVYSSALGRPEIASLAGAVSDAAASGDGVAASILQEAGAELARLAVAVSRRLDFRRRLVEVGAVGGVLRGSAAVRTAFTAAVRTEIANATVVAPRLPAAVAAGILALERCGTTVDDALVHNVQTTLPTAGIKA